MDVLPGRLLPPFLSQSESFLTIRLRNEFRTRLLERYAGERLGPTHGAILICLEGEPPLTQKGLVELVRMDPSDAVRLLDELEQRGFVQRAPDPADRRRNLLILTTDGRTQVGRCKAIIAAAEEELLSPLTADERVTLHRLLTRLVSAVDNRIPPETMADNPATRAKQRRG